MPSLSFWLTLNFTRVRTVVPSLIAKAIDSIMSRLASRDDTKKPRCPKWGLLVLFLFGPATQVQALDSFACDGRFFLSQGADNTQLHLVALSANPPNFTPIGALASMEYNAMGFNPVDGFLYAIRVTGNPSGNNNAQLLRIGSDGTVEVVDANPTSSNENGVGNLPKNDQYISATFAPDGRFFVIGVNRVNEIKLIDVTGDPIEATDLDLSRNIDVNDIAWVGGNAPDASLYSVTVPQSTEGDAAVLRIDPVTGVVTTIGQTLTDGLRFGALFGAPNGLFGVANGGQGLYQFDLATGRATRLSAAPGSNVNDGANCPIFAPPFEADLAVRKTNTPLVGPDDQTDDTYVAGEVRSYSIVVSNSGPYGASGVRVIDLLPDGIEAATASWTCGNEIGGGVCSQSSASGGGIDASVDLPVTVDQSTGAIIPSSVTFELSVTVPVDFGGDLRNRVEVIAPDTSVDPNLNNNEAVDVDPT
ncbi:conserved repeat domain protein, partial [Rhizobium sp. PDO1-076]|uniref:DUF6923 family protein n=1 Tax=Rhizobium sp. PDO1-076 TaxID=1125979 RepID=UPI00024E30B2